MKLPALAATALLALHAAPAAAFPTVYTEYTNATAWDTAYDVGAFTTLTFVGYSDGSVLSTQYTTQGATFTAGTHAAVVNATVFADGTGLGVGTGGVVWFGTPICAVAADHPGGLQFVLRDANGAILQSSTTFGGAGTGLFAGVISTVPVQSVQLLDPTDNSGYVDNLMFGPCPPDGDADGIADAADNCPGADNAGQADQDGDGYGDLCDPPSCGNGYVEAPETCDGDGAGAGGETATCNLDCTAADCGDGIINVAASEECEGGDGCDTDCSLSGSASCGDGVVSGVEVCDDGNTDDGDGCAATCASDETCGNGVLELDETCEDGNAADGDGCSATCEIEEAGGGGCDAGGAGASPWLLLIGLGALIRRRPVHA